jgi:hypothetical protein
MKEEKKKQKTQRKRSMKENILIEFQGTYL